MNKLDQLISSVNFLSLNGYSIKLLKRAIYYCDQFIKNKLTISELQFYIDSIHSNLEVNVGKDILDELFYFVEELESILFLCDTDKQFEKASEKAESLKKFINSKINKNNEFKKLSPFMYEIKQQLIDLLDKVKSREEVASWAGNILLNEQQLTDEERNYLLNLKTIDLVNNRSKQYVYSDEKIFEWLIDHIV